MNPEATLFGDGSWVIIGYHLSLDEAREIMQKEDPELKFGDILHCWVRYEFADADEREEYGILSWWRLHEYIKPKGIVKLATAMIG